jgi:hypothetical protein
MQRELDAEVAHSKKVQEEASRRPPPSSTTSISQSSRGALSHEAQKKLELFENMTGLVIVSYSESIRQPGNVKMLTYTCVLSVEQRGKYFSSCIRLVSHITFSNTLIIEFPFKIVVWDEKLENSGETAEHAVYSPGTPIDPDLDLGYLASSFTFPRSQLNVFYQNMLSILSPPAEEEEAEEEYDDEI